MRETGTIKVEKRTDINSRVNKRLRESGFLPANVYGKGIDSISVMVKKDELKKNLLKYGRNSVFKLDIGGDEPYSVIAKEIQYGPVNREPLHVDFLQVSFSEKIKTNVAVRVIGKDQVEAKRMILLQHLDILPVNGLPQNIPDVIDLDVSDLQVGQNIFVGDIKLPEGITTQMSLQELVISVVESKTQLPEEEITNDTTQA